MLHSELIGGKAIALNACLRRRVGVRLSVRKGADSGPWKPFNERLQDLTPFLPLFRFRQGGITPAWSQATLVDSAGSYAPRLMMRHE